MTQIIKMPSRAQENEHPVADCPECGALANVEKLRPGGLTIKCPLCKFTMSSAIDPEFVVRMWNGLSKRGDK